MVFWMISMIPYFVKKPDLVTGYFCQKENLNLNVPLYKTSKAFQFVIEDVHGVVNWRGALQ